MAIIRLNKYLASLGVASRRKIDAMVEAGRITINGEKAVLGDKVDPETDTIVVDKKIIPPKPQELVYYALNKPKYVLSSSSDNRYRQTVVQYVPDFPRVFPVGRLDYESTGLILLTNDGDLTLRLTHPRYHLPKTYLVTILGKVSADKIKQLETGVELDDGRTAPAKAQPAGVNFKNTTLKIVLYQGKKRQIRRMCAALHLHLLDLHRISIGPLDIGDLQPGEYRALTDEEIAALKN